MGVIALVANDTGTVKGRVVEITFDYFAQDKSGNVWYFGESASQVQNGVVIGHAGSWLGGVNGAQPGIVMEANPKVGDFYCQENSPGVAQDQARVLGVTRSICVPYTCTHHNGLKTKETSPLEPGVVEDKWYALQAGEIQAMDVKGGTDLSQLVAILNP